LFGGLTEVQSEQTPFVPRSPYAAAKLYAHNMVDIYRKSYETHACCGILFNHESPRRGLDFVTRKITNSIAKFKLGIGGPVELGNLDAMRDWGHAKDYVNAMWMMLQTDAPKDYVVATGKTISIRTALQYVCDIAGVDFNKAYKLNSSHVRPLEVSVLRGDSSKIQFELGWKPQYDWASLLKEMYESDYASVLNVGGSQKIETTKA
jgi:GDPmannose 4,6-dehydratase